MLDGKSSVQIESSNDCTIKLIIDWKKGTKYFEVTKRDTTKRLYSPMSAKKYYENLSKKDK